eukprot:14620596-Heterocapsa_arctica.AAC.1
MNLRPKRLFLHSSKAQQFLRSWASAWMAAEALVWAIDRLRGGSARISKALSYDRVEMDKSRRVSA